MSAIRHVKPQVRAQRAYTLAALDAPVKVNQNENPFDVPDALKQRVLDRALRTAWSRYPPFDPVELQQALAAFAGWRADGVLVGNGSNELIEALLVVTVAERTPVVIPQPTFTLYALLARILGGTVVEVPLGDDLAYDVAAIAEARRREEAPVTIVCSPNNPTGSVLSRDEVAALCGGGDGLVVVDEAYHEFSGRSVAPLLAEHENLVVLRTFSKAMGMAGLRVGYLMAAPELVAEIDKARLPYNLNVVSQLAALELLREPAVVDRAVRTLIAERDRLRLALDARGDVRVYPSAANFLLVELRTRSPRQVFSALHERGVLVRDVSSYPRLSRCLRVSVGSAEENDRFLAALADVLAPVAEERP